MNRMSKKVEKMLNPLRRDGSGQGALAIVLLLLLMGAVIIVPLLVFMQTGLRAGGVYESKMGAFYAADSGVEDALWWIKNAQPDLTEKFPDYDVFDYDTNYSYLLPDEVNNWNVSVAITNIWIPTAGEELNAEEKRLIVEEGRLIVFGGGITLGGAPAYEITMIYYYDTDASSPYYDPNGTKLVVDNIGIWLSGGFHNVRGSGSLGTYDSDPTVAPRCGGEAIVWDVDTPFRNLPGGTGYPMTKVVNFQFTGPSGQYPTALSWVETSGVSDLTLSWDADSKPYRIISTAGNTTAEAYVIKSEMRKMGAAVEGDYYASGNTLMQCDKGVGQGNRNRLYKQTTTTVTDDDIPPSATVEAAFLYWSGWISPVYCYKTRFSSAWKEIPELKYPAYPTVENLTKLVEKYARVNNVTFKIEGNTTVLTTHEWQLDENIEHRGTWSYSCFYDVTPLVKAAIRAGDIDPNGAATYTVGHAVIEPRPNYSEFSFTLYPTTDKTGYPLGTPSRSCGSQSVAQFDWAYAGWSLVIVYSSPDTLRHQLYLFDKFAYAAEKSNVDFDDDGAPGGNVAGFLAPAAIAEEEYAARLTCFVGEGDQKYKPDRIILNGVALSNAVSPEDNVWNEKSPGGIIEGVDIDTFTVSYPTIEPGDTSAKVDLPTNTDSWNLVYIILSFRSNITIGGTINYLIR